MTSLLIVDINTLSSQEAFEMAPNGMVSYSPSVLSDTTSKALNIFLSAPLSLMSLLTSLANF
jgi:hypothetical protein